MHAEAVNVIKERNPLPLICGRVCPAPCEDGCRRAAIEDEAVHHNYLKRFVADWDMNLPDRKPPAVLPDTGKKVAIIGGGPCGLSAAYYLRRIGHSPTIFDAKPELGGMLRYGIPEYRLPKKVLDFEIQDILDLGVETRRWTCRSVPTTRSRTSRRTTTPSCSRWGPGTTPPFVARERISTAYGRAPSSCRSASWASRLNLTGKRVVVVGGGNTAMDASRSALRMGAVETILLYRRTRNEMPANRVEIDAAEDEGVQYHLLGGPDTPHR